MTVLNSVRAYSKWALDVNSFNRSGRRITPEFLDLLKKRFQFSDINPSSEDFPFFLKNGSFDSSEGPIRVNLTISRTYCDVETRASTDAGDAFLQVFLDAAFEFFGTAPDRSVVQARSYVSELNFHSSADLLDSHDRFGKIIETASEALAIPIHLASIRFSADPYSGDWPLIVERKISSAFGTGYWYSQAALPTNDHISILQQLESALCP